MGFFYIYFLVFTHRTLAKHYEGDGIKLTT